MSGPRKWGLYANWPDKQDFSCTKHKISPGENWVNEVAMEIDLEM